jgi:hypothetical protein
LCGGFFGLLFFLFFGVLFGDSSFSGFVAALVGPGEFRGCVGFLGRTSAVGAGAGWDRRDGEFAGPVRFAGAAGSVYVEAVGDAGREAG